MRLVAPTLLKGASHPLRVPNLQRTGVSLSRSSAAHRSSHFPAIYFQFCIPPTSWATMQKVVTWMPKGLEERRPLWRYKHAIRYSKSWICLAKQRLRVRPGVPITFCISSLCISGSRLCKIPIFVHRRTPPLSFCRFSNDLRFHFAQFWRSLSSTEGTAVAAKGLSTKFMKAMYIIV